jgi:hypothetical protein
MTDEELEAALAQALKELEAAEAAREAARLAMVAETERVNDVLFKCTNPDCVCDQLDNPGLARRIKTDWLEVANSRSLWSELYRDNCLEIGFESPPQNIGEVRIGLYHGTFGDSVVLRLFSAEMQKAAHICGCDIVIAGYYFNCHILDHKLVWNNGIIYNLITAYESGLLTVEDIEQLHEVW